MAKKDKKIKKENQKNTVDIKKTLTSATDKPNFKKYQTKESFGYHNANNSPLQCLKDNSIEPLMETIRKEKRLVKLVVGIVIANYENDKELIGQAKITTIAPISNKEVWKFLGVTSGVISLEEAKKL